jgi:hypothetical protein
MLRIGAILLVALMMCGLLLQGCGLDQGSKLSAEKAQLDKTLAQDKQELADLEQLLMKLPAERAREATLIKETKSLKAEKERLQKKIAQLKKEGRL